MRNESRALTARSRLDCLGMKDMTTGKGVSKRPFMERSTREKVLVLLDPLPEQATLADVLDGLNLLITLEERLKDADEPTFSQAEVEAHFAKWLQ